MFCSRMMKELKFLRIRQIHSTIIKYEEKAVSNNANKPSSSTSPEENMFGAPLHTCTNLDKKILVWVKRYPSLDQVPDKVTLDCIHKAHGAVRIQVGFLMMAITIVAFIGSVVFGKRDVAAGKNILTENLKHYEKIKQQAKEEQEKAGKQ